MPSWSLDWVEKSVGSGDEQLIRLDRFDREPARLRLRGRQTELGRLHVFRYVLAA